MSDALRSCWQGAGGSFIQGTIVVRMGCFFFVLVFVLVVGCAEPLRPPYLTPELQNWPETYEGTPGLGLHVFQTGTLTLPGRLVYEGGSLFTPTELDVLVFVIEHPTQGLILVGTGLNPDIAENSEAYLEPVLAAVGKADLEEGQNIVAQLETARLAVDRVTRILMPDLRPDHAGELEYFSEAVAVVTTAEHAAATEQTGLGAYLSKEYDQVATWEFIDFGQAQPLGMFVDHQDLFGDGSVVLLDATGMTAGGLAVLIRLPSGPVLLCGNLAWTKEQYLYARLPGLVFDRGGWWDKVWRLKKWKELAPELVVLPDHEWKAVEAAVTADMQLHVFEAKEDGEDVKRETEGIKRDV